MIIGVPLFGSIIKARIFTSISIRTPYTTLPDLPIARKDYWFLLQSPTRPRFHLRDYDRPRNSRLCGRSNVRRDRFPIANSVSPPAHSTRSEEHTSELQSQSN